MSNQTLEAFVNSIQNLYQHQSKSSSQQQNQSTSSASSHHDLNYNEIFNTINSSLNVFLENDANNLLDNLLPIFTLPEYTVPNMAVLYAIITQQSLAQQLSNKQDLGIDTSGSAPNRASGAAAAGITPSVANLNQDKLLNEIENCIQFSDERQVEVATEVYSELCHYYANRLCKINKPKRGLAILRQAIKKIQYDSSNGKIRLNQLTPVHADLLQLSLASQNFTIALSLMSHDILDLHKPSSSSTSSASFDSKYLLSYFYYAGCISAAMKSYDSALFFFEQSLVTPAMAVSQIMVESYKKFILISLISKGKLPLLPKYTSRIVVNQIKPICSVYHELASAYVNYDQDKLMQLSQKYHDVFTRDGNLGLIKQLHQSFNKKNIQKLTKTFITLSLADMAVKVKLGSAKEAETLMLNMIRDGEIFAQINQKDGMVSFHDNPEKFDNPNIMEELNKQMFSCIEMDANIKEMDREITTHPHYIQKCQANASSLVDEGTDQLLTTDNVFQNITSAI